MRLWVCDDTVVNLDWFNDVVIVLTPLDSTKCKVSII